MYVYREGAVICTWDDTYAEKTPSGIFNGADDGELRFW